MLKKVLSFMMCGMMVIGTMLAAVPLLAYADSAEQELNSLVMFRNAATGAYITTGNGTNYSALTVSYNPNLTDAIFRVGDLTQDHLFQPYNKYLSADYNDLTDITAFRFTQTANGLYRILMNTANFGYLILAHSENSANLSTIHASAGYVASDTEYWELITLPENTMVRLRNIGSGKYLTHANADTYNELSFSSDVGGINTLFCIDSLNGQTSFQPLGKEFSPSYSGSGISYFSFSLNSNGTYLFTVKPASYTMQYLGSNIFDTISISTSESPSNQYYCWDVEVVDIALANTMIRIRNIDYGQYLSHANATGYNGVSLTSNGTGTDTLFCVGSLDEQTYLQPYHKGFVEVFDYTNQDYYDQWSLNYFEFIPNSEGSYRIRFNATSQDTSEAWIWYLYCYTTYEGLNQISWSTNVDASGEKANWSIEVVTPTAETTVRIRNLGTGQYLSHANATGYASLGFTSDCTDNDTLFCVDTITGTQTCVQPFDREFALFYGSYAIEYFNFSQNSDGTYLWNVKPTSNSMQFVAANSSGAVTYISSASAANQYACWEIIEVTAP